MFRFLCILKVLVLACFWVSNIALATIYRTSYLPGMSLRLGCGFDPSNPTKTAIEGIIDFERELESRINSEDEPTFRLKIVKCVSDLYQALGIDENPPVFCALAPNQIGNHLPGQEFIGPDSLTFLLASERRFPFERLGCPRLTRALNTICDETALSFLGPETVVKQQRMATFYVLVSFQDISPSKKAMIEDRLHEVAEAGQDDRLVPENLGLLLRDYEDTDVCMAIHGFGFRHVLKPSILRCSHPCGQNLTSDKWMRLLEELKDRLRSASFQSAIPTLFQTKATAELLGILRVNSSTW